MGWVMMTHVPSAAGLRESLCRDESALRVLPVQPWFWLIGPPAWVSNLSSVTREAGITSKVLPQFTPLIWEMNFTSLPLTSSWTALSLLNRCLPKKMTLQFLQFKTEFLWNDYFLNRQQIIINMLNGKNPIKLWSLVLST